MSTACKVLKSHKKSHKKSHRAIQSNNVGGMGKTGKQTIHFPEMLLALWSHGSIYSENFESAWSHVTAFKKKNVLAHCYFCARPLWHALSPGPYRRKARKYWMRVSEQPTRRCLHCLLTARVSPRRNPACWLWAPPCSSARPAESGPDKIDPKPQRLCLHTMWCCLNN